MAGKVLAKRGRVETVDLLLQLASLVYRLNSAGIVIVFSAIVFFFFFLKREENINLKSYILTTAEVVE